MAFYHLRYTPNDLTQDLSGLVAKFPRYIVAREGGNEGIALHFHILLETPQSDDSIRTAVRDTLHIPKMGRGQTNKYYVLKKWNDDPRYICKGGDIVLFKGYTMEQIHTAIKDGKDAYKYKGHQKSPGDKKATIRHGDGGWVTIRNAALATKCVTYEEFAKFLNYYYVKNGMPLQHPANIKRYAKTLNILRRAEGDDDKLHDLTDTVEVLREYD